MVCGQEFVDIDRTNLHAKFVSSIFLFKIKHSFLKESSNCKLINWASKQEAIRKRANLDNEISNDLVAKSK